MATAPLPPPAPIQAVLPTGWNKDLPQHFALINNEPASLVGLRVVMYKPQKEDKNKGKADLKTPAAKPKAKAKSKEVDRVGLQLWQEHPPTPFDPKNYPQPPHWASLITPSAYCESRYGFEALNTYDRANFTIGFIQFGAHTRDDNFHRFLRLAMQMRPDQAARYFPELRVHENHIDLERWEPVTDKWVRLTSPKDPDNLALRLFLKPLRAEVTGAEVLFAARMIHWVRHEKALRDLMVEIAIARAQADMKRLGASLDGKGIDLCALIFDILLQGRGKWTEEVPTTPVQKIQSALAANKPFEALQAIRSNAKYEINRVHHVSAKIVERFAGSTVTYEAKTCTLKAAGQGEDA